MSAVTVLGLGAMGSRMAINFARAGHEVTVWNRTLAVAEELSAPFGLVVAPTPAAAAEGADVVVAMVRDDEAAHGVWLHPDHGALRAMRSEGLAIESSTLTPGAVRHLGRSAAELGVRFVEAPVVGSRPQATAGALLYLLGGDADAVGAASSIVDVNAGASRHVGALGDASIMKLAINGLFAAQVAAYGEMVGFVERSGLDPAAAIETLAGLPITSPGLQRILGLIGERRFEPNFPVHLVAKDLSYLVDTAGDVGASVPIADSARRVFEQRAAGPARDLDIAGIAAGYRAP